ncbi:uncharacterized protein BO96DRAFT_346319 [Aspergillus niger CBS 101883]|uniref:uncharacterized protein n=1 Tax=Aspergillus lacticoffeatus (strain CBS 101883) TaxID=1450533 RepID=UPI000D7F9DFB|nr:uncharacterized protein BO96DRAFT_346319 [Aspergillus niger CBS 101883]PYH53010.1 hypothetical protein BO96DRAFT_346319 [Aspergillus niger CBS 101883]
MASRPSHVYTPVKPPRVTPLVMSIPNDSSVDLRILPQRVGRLGPTWALTANDIYRMLRIYEMSAGVQMVLYTSLEGAEAAPGPWYQQELARLSSAGNGSSNTRAPSVTIGGTVLTVVPTVID